MMREAIRRRLNEFKEDPAEVHNVGLMLLDGGSRLSRELSGNFCTKTDLMIRYR